MIKLSLSRPYVTIDTDYKWPFYKVFRQTHKKNNSFHWIFQYLYSLIIFFNLKKKYKLRASVSVIHLKQMIEPRKYLSNKMFILNGNSVSINFYYFIYFSFTLFCKKIIKKWFFDNSSFFVCFDSMQYLCSFTCKLLNLEPNRFMRRESIIMKRNKNIMLLIIAEIVYILLAAIDTKTVTVALALPRR